jgi:hypothetical protein
MGLSYPPFSHFSAMACYASWNGQWGGCSGQVASAGNVTEQVNLSSAIPTYWNTNGGGDFGYVWVNADSNTYISGLEFY